METQILSAIDKQEKSFNTFITSLVHKFQPLYIFCFSKKSIIQESRGCFKRVGFNHHSEYCLLLVTETNTRIDHEVQEFSNHRFRNGKVTILCHGKDAISEAIHSKNSFFMMVYATGQLLYSHDGMNPFSANINFVSRPSAIKAKESLDYRMPLADGFLRGAAECLARQDFNISTFMLHQVVEQSCIALISVHMAYRSEVHNLQRMLRLSTSFSDRPLQLFLSGSPEDERLFDLLTKSYTGARYKDNFKVNGHDAESLYQRVSSFVEVVKEMCHQKIDQLKAEDLLSLELSGKVETLLN